MPCHYPLQAYCSVRDDGKKSLVFSNVLARMFRFGAKMPDDCISVVCGQCMFCRLERSRETATRALHESRLYDDNCFVTLTFSEDGLKKMCPLTDGGYSLVREHTQLFMKRLRKKFASGFNFVDRDGKEHFYQSRNVRALGCGEYGEKNGRPHYHFCLFNCYFPDRVYLKSVNGFKYFTSVVLQSLWQYGNSIVSDFSFETAAYVARYCTKKVTGDKAVDHYRGRLPEFPIWPLRPGLGKPWFDKFGKTDVLPTDSCVVRGALCKVPRYYDVLRGRDDPEGLVRAKLLRSERASLKSDDNSYRRLRVKEKCMDARIRLLIRNLEK